ncbi:hypothetical protein GCM10009661_46500 [Catellatospora chokoriensis]
MAAAARRARPATLSPGRHHRPRAFDIRAALFSRFFTRGRTARSGRFLALAGDLRISEYVVTEDRPDTAHLADLADALRRTRAALAYAAEADDAAAPALKNDMSNAAAQHARRPSGAIPGRPSCVPGGR